jgi:hypothetical protein
MKYIDLTNEKFGYWTVIEKSIRPPTKSKSKPIYWKCRCECGNERIIPAHNLRCKLTSSCGCKNIFPDYLALYNKLLTSSKISKHKCDLKFEEFVKFTKIKKCFYCHSPIFWKKHGLLKSYNLDRKDNSLGYTKDNCVVCCKRCNFSKSARFSYEEWYGMTNYLRQLKVNR